MLFGDPVTTFERARTLQLPRAERRALSELEQTIKAAREQNSGSELLRDLTLDLGELRGFEYYTGMRVHAFVKGAGGPVLRGGRYNRLVQRYGREAFATGFAVDIEALAQAESASELSTPTHLQPGCMLIADKQHRALAAGIARRLREMSVRVAMEDASNWPTEQREALLAYAQRVGLPSVLLLAADECEVLHVGWPAVSLGPSGIGTNSNQTSAQSISDALVTMLSGRES
jgi:ATP phosphoribosyltransferase regulatory subunit